MTGKVEGEEKGGKGEKGEGNEREGEGGGGEEGGGGSGGGKGREGEGGGCDQVAIDIAELSLSEQHLETAALDSHVIVATPTTRSDDSHMTTTDQSQHSDGEHCVEPPVLEGTLILKARRESESAVVEERREVEILRRLSEPVELGGEGVSAQECSSSFTGPQRSKPIPIKVHVYIHACMYRGETLLVSLSFYQLMGVQ